MIMNIIFIYAFYLDWVISYKRGALCQHAIWDMYTHICNLEFAFILKKLQGLQTPLCPGGYLLCTRIQDSMIYLKGEDAGRVLFARCRI